jgi:hypothetical protein
VTKFVCFVIQKLKKLTSVLEASQQFIFKYIRPLIVLEGGQTLNGIQSQLNIIEQTTKMK